MSNRKYKSIWKFAVSVIGLLALGAGCAQDDSGITWSSDAGGMPRRGPAPERLDADLPMATGGQAGNTTALGGQAGVQPSTGGQAGRTTNTGGQAGAQPATGGQAGNTTTTGGQAGNTIATGGQAGSTTTTGGQAGSATTGGQAGVQTATGGQAGRTTVTGGQAGAQPATGGQAGAQPATGGQAGAQPATGGQAGFQPSTGGQAGNSAVACEPLPGNSRLTKINWTPSETSNSASPCHNSFGQSVGWDDISGVCYPKTVWCGPSVESQGSNPVPLDVSSQQQVRPCEAKCPAGATTYTFPPSTISVWGSTVRGSPFTSNAPAAQIDYRCVSNTSPYTINC